MNDTVTIDRELLGRAVGQSDKSTLLALQELRAILAAPRQPEGDGLEVRATEEYHLTKGGVEYYDLCRLSDAQRAIAELREVNRVQLEMATVHGAACAEIRKERDTLRQQLAERDADAERWRYTRHPDYFCCGPYDTDGDYCGYSVGILKYANGKQLSLSRCIEGQGDSLEDAIDAALTELTP